MLLRQEQKNRRRAAFTLMEMLVVVAIIVALAGIGGFFLLGQLEDSKKSAGSLKAASLTQACVSYKIKHGSFPDNLDMLTEKDDGGQIFLESKDSLKDPWDIPYIYDKSGQNNRGMKPDISFKTPDGQIVGNWPKNR